MTHDVGPSDHTVLITGGGGFIGSHLADALVETNDVRILDDFSTGFRAQVPDEAEIIAGDIRDAEAVERAVAGVDVVFHEAAVVSVPKTVADPLTSNAVNIDAGLRLLEQARTEEARFVVASSAAIYGTPETVPIDEDDAFDPQSPYGIQKLSLDHYTRLYHDLYGTETVALRYFNVYGPRAESGEYGDVVSVFRRQAQAGDPITIEGSGEQTRDFVHVDDVVQANLRAATTTEVGEAYNIGCGTAITINDLAERIRERTGGHSAIKHVDPRPGDIDESLADISKARERLGYEPTVTLDEGLESVL